MKHCINTLVLVLTLAMTLTGTAFATPVGCVITMVTVYRDGMSSLDKQDVCMGGECVDFPLPGCTNATIQICFGAEEYAEQIIGCRIQESGGFHLACGATDDFPYYRRGIGDRAAYICTEGWPTCASGEWSDYYHYIDSWNDGNWVVAGWRTFTCDCQREECY